MSSTKIVDASKEHNVHGNEILPKTSFSREVHIPCSLVDLLPKTHYSNKKSSRT